MIARIGKLLTGLGLAGFVGATAWWYMFFEQLLGESVKRASECFYTTTTACEIGNLAGSFGDVPTYSPAAMWLSLAITMLGGLISAFAPKGRATPRED